MDCGINITVGDGVCLQDQGGITIGDGMLIGHHMVMATFNHELAPNKRQELIPQPIHIGKNIWIDSNTTILQGVTVGDNAGIAAG